jgi:predicted porin
MRKQLGAALALAALSQDGLAQTNVAVYGMIDAGLSFETGNKAGSVTNVTSGIAGGSRLGFKGSEDLGGGSRALFVIESGIQVDTGTSGQGGLPFGRQVFVGIGNDRAGTLTLGRQYAPHYLATVFADPFSSGTSADEKNLMNAVSDGGRMSNSIKYASPQWRGFSGELVYAAGEVNGGGNTAGRAAGFGIAYDMGRLALRLAYHDKNNDTAGTQIDSARNTFIAATYAFPRAKLHLGYGVNKGPYSSTLRNANNPYGYAVVPTAFSLTDDSTDAIAGVTVPLGAHTLLASWIHKDDKTVGNRDADQFGLGYRYNLSLRTNLYAVYARMRNKNGASYTLGNASDGGSGDRAVNLGMQYAF